MVCIEILGLYGCVRVLCSNDQAMANKVLAVAFGAPFGIAGRPCFSKQLTASYLPLLGQYGKRIRTSKALGGLRVEGLFNYLTGVGDRTSPNHLYIQYQNSCQGIRWESVTSQRLL